VCVCVCVCVRVCVCVCACARHEKQTRARITLAFAKCHARRVCVCVRAFAPCVFCTFVLTQRMCVSVRVRVRAVTFIELGIPFLGIAAPATTSSASSVA
jgi:hypothetical protein